MGLYFCWRSWTSCSDAWHHGFYQIPTYKTNLNLTASVTNLIMGRVSIFHQDNNPKQTSKSTQKCVTEHKMKLLPWLSLSSDLNPTENEWGELKRRSTVVELWIWRIWRDSVWRKWSLISYQVFSKLFRHYRRKLWPTWTRESIYLTMRFSPHFQLFYFNDRLEFCVCFE